MFFVMRLKVLLLMDRINKHLLVAVSFIWIVLLIQSVKSASELACDPAVMKIFGWCEQWDCVSNCTCVTTDDCKQYCGERNCQEMNCYSSSLCAQRLHVSDAMTSKPHVRRIYAESPTITQNCDNGKCESLSAMRNSKDKTNVRYFSLQNCAEGECKNVIATTDVSKQFCSNVDLMHCYGSHSSNCTQTCVVGKCNTMKCEAKFCEQLCSYKSNCNMECPKGVKQCYQKCDTNSTCTLSCNADKCIQNCNGAKDCRILKSTLPPTTLSTPKFTTLSTTLNVHSNSTVIPSSKIIYIPTETSKRTTPLSNYVETRDSAELGYSSASSSISHKVLGWLVYIMIISNLALNFFKD